jgi:hypothetical protein
MIYAFWFLLGLCVGALGVITFATWWFTHE